MSHYKSAIRTQSQQESPDSQHFSNARQLQELFSSWTIDDLQLLLTEVNGDVDLAATKIYDGTAVPWGEVSRKKDKRVPTPAHTPKPSTSGRGEPRGARGGRGGRGGAGRVTRGGRGASSKSGANGHVPHADSPHPSHSGAVTNDIPSHSAETNFNATAHAAAPKQASKTPATSKLSWAQIAHPQDKATTPPSQAQPPAVTPQTVSSVPIPETQSELEQNGWEEPTTAEAPIWDEPKHAEVWAPAEASETLKADSLIVGASEDSEIQEGPGIGIPEVVAEPSETMIIIAVSVSPVAQTPSNLPPVIPSPKLTTRPAVSSHRSSARYKVPDQPVTLPLSFGSGIEKVGMQFGSLNLGDNATETSPPESEVNATVPEPTPAPVLQPKVETAPSVPAPTTATAASTSLTSVFHQQQLPPSAPQPQPSLPTAQSSVPHHSLPSSVSQPIASSQTAAHATASPLQTSAQQPITHNVVQQQSQHQPHLQQPQHLPHLPQQLQQNQAVHTFNQHILPLHLEPSQQTPIPQQPLQSATHSTYFRAADVSATTPYFHAPTPPVAQAQDNSYGSFGQLGTQNQQQPPHLGAFSNNDYGYSEAARDFYNSYPQQQGFASRNLGHEDVKSLSGGQQPATSTVPPSNPQGPPTHSSQGSNQPQTTSQGPQQYPPPVPYYYPPYSQGQYYGSPYSSGYVPQPFVKYPAMFQPGPPGPGSTANPATKQPGGNAVVGVQPQTNPYSQLYQQGSYDDYQAHPHHAQHHHQHSHSLGLGQGGVGDYSKQLYSGAGGNIQGFIGLGGHSGAGPTSSAGPRGGNSPDTHYKPYTSKDVGVTGGRNVASQGQVPPQSQNQGPAGQGTQGQSFYPGNRFGSGISSSGGGGGTSGPQQSGPQTHLAYPQAVNEPSYYGYQPRQQQFWQ